MYVDEDEEERIVDEEFDRQMHAIEDELQTMDRKKDINDTQNDEQEQDIE